jgi:hypothetical protein
MSTGYLSFSEGKYRIIVGGMPICVDGTLQNALLAARAMKVSVKPEAWNGDRSEWVHISTIDFTA